jgi:hypothetical protein
MIELTTPFGVYLGDLFCPFCGAKVLAGDGEELPPCPHLAFIYLGDIDDFMFSTPPIEEAVDEAYSKALDEHSDLDKLALADSLLPKKLGVTMVFHTSGMGCGPVSSTIALGFAFRPDLARSQ